LNDANLYRAHLEDADLRLAHLEGARLYGVHLEGASLYRAHLEGTELNGAFFDATTRLREVILCNKQHGTVSVAGVHWGDADLTVIDWTQVKRLGDECLAHESKNRSGAQKNAVERLEEHQRAVRANSKLAIALQEQGLNEEAARFAYRAQRLQKTVLRLRATQSRMNIKERIRMMRAWLFSWFLFLLTGYGYKPGRSFLAYFLVIVGFTVVYYLLRDTINPPFTPFGAFIFSMTSFHGRGFLPLLIFRLTVPLQLWLHSKPL
jgi:Pentapeptide repeats (8 copies)